MYSTTGEPRQDSVERELGAELNAELGEETRKLSRSRKNFNRTTHMITKAKKKLYKAK